MCGQFEFRTFLPTISCSCDVVHCLLRPRGDCRSSYFDYYFRILTETQRSDWCVIKVQCAASIALTQHLAPEIGHTRLSGDFYLWPADWRQGWSVQIFLVPSPLHAVIQNFKLQEQKLHTTITLDPAHLRHF
jgi:hypothetical protein